MKKYCRKGCPLYAIQVLESIEDDKPNLTDHPILREYKDVFPEEIPGLPPRRDIDFSIELAPGAVPTSRTPYRMSKPEMVIHVGSSRLVCEKIKMAHYDYA
jgi:hypothetical protein